MLYSAVNQSEFTVVLCHYGCPYSTVAGCSAHSGFADGDGSHLEPCQSI